MNVPITDCAINLWIATFYYFVILVFVISLCMIFL